MYIVPESTVSMLWGHMTSIGQFHSQHHMAQETGVNKTNHKQAPLMFKAAAHLSASSSPIRQSWVASTAAMPSLWDPKFPAPLMVSLFCFCVQVHKAWAAIGLAPPLLEDLCREGVPGNYTYIVMQDLLAQGFQMVSSLSLDDEDRALAKQLALAALKDVPDSTGTWAPPESVGWHSPWAEGLVTGHGVENVHGRVGVSGR